MAEVGRWLLGVGARVGGVGLGGAVEFGRFGVATFNNAGVRLESGDREVGEGYDVVQNS